MEYREIKRKGGIGRKRPVKVKEPKKFVHGPKLSEYDTKREVWKRIYFPWDDTKYGWEISNMGRIRKVRSPKNFRILKINYSGNLVYSKLYYEGKLRMVSLNNLVRKYFTNISRGKLVYKDNNPLNPRADNMTQKKGKLSNHKVKAIKYLLFKGVSVPKIAKRLRVKQSDIRLIAAGKTYRKVIVHVEEFESEFYGRFEELL